MRYDSVGRRVIHMAGVSDPLDVLWLEGQRVNRVSRLPAWRGFGVAKASTVVELPAGAADEIQPDDQILLRD
jgi:hypothetical protein